MTIPTFNFPYHRVVTEYPDNAYRVQFGGAYEFVSKPSAPPQRIFTLKFSVMAFMFDSNGNVDATIQPKINYKALRNFYESVGLYDKFYYPHPEFGTLLVRFHRPLKDPDPIESGEGAMGAFELEFIEQP